MKEEFQRIYIKYKKQVVPVVLISAMFFILFRVILPQTSEISEKSQDIEQLTREIEDLRKTESTLANFNSTEADDNIEIVTKALPGTKDISIIFSAITGVAADADVEVSDFSLTVGGLYGRAIEGSNVQGVPALDVTVRFESQDPKNFINLANLIQKRLPLVEIKSIDTTGTRGIFELGFYYKPVDLTLLNRKTVVTPLTQADINLLNQLKDWDN